MIAIFIIQIGPDCVTINLRGLKAKTFQTPLNGALSHTIQPPPQSFSMLRFATLVIFSKRDPAYAQS